ncbi:MAG: hypothetical protein LBS21_01570, partial [Clostridiales bacterium]|nr:hypothetical protein [Clostridiales bacterium]
ITFVILSVLGFFFYCLTSFLPSLPLLYSPTHSVGLELESNKLFCVIILAIKLTLSFCFASKTLYHFRGRFSSEILDL